MAGAKATAAVVVHSGRPWAIASRALWGPAWAAGRQAERRHRVTCSAAPCLFPCTMAGAQALDGFLESINAVKPQGHCMDASSERKCQMSFPAGFGESMLYDSVVNKYLILTKTL